MTAKINAGSKILDGLRDVLSGNFAAVTIEGQRWVRAPEWQPIETYDPKHELNVLVVDEGVVSEAYYNGESDAWFKEGKSEHDFDFVNSDRLFPTHWMPLPSPPVQS